MYVLRLSPLVLAVFMRKFSGTGRSDYFVFMFLHTPHDVQLECFFCFAPLSFKVFCPCSLSQLAWQAYSLPQGSRRPPLRFSPALLVFFLSRLHLTI